MITQPADPFDPEVFNRRFGINGGPPAEPAQPPPPVRRRFSAMTGDQGSSIRRRRVKVVPATERQERTPSMINAIEWWTWRKVRQRPATTASIDFKCQFAPTPGEPQQFRPVAGALTAHLAICSGT